MIGAIILGSALMTLTFVLVGVAVAVTTKVDPTRRNYAVGVLCLFLAFVCLAVLA